MELQTNDSRIYRTRKFMTTRLVPALFHVLQHVGIDVLPRRYYSEIPDIRVLKETVDWRRPLRMDRIAGSDPDAQLVNARGSMPSSVREVAARVNLFRSICEEAGYLGFGDLETQALIGFIASHRPQRILQVGCGVSTAAILRGATIGGYRPAITCIEPYPSQYLRARGADGDIELLEVKAQALKPAEVQSRVAACDFLFIDSTHTLGPAGEVTRLIVEWLPQLNAGAFAHFHDIHFPYDYGPSTLTSCYFPHETALLHAFLTENVRFEIYFSLSMLHHYKRQEIAELYSHYEPAPMIDNIRSGSGMYPPSTFLRVLRKNEHA